MNPVDMESQPHLQMINPTEATHDVDFTHFTRLPKELRLKIWRCALQRQRIIGLRLINQRGRTAEEVGENPDAIRNGERYFTTVNGTQVLSKLLRVSKESREEALLFYRVHLPCSFTGVGTKSHGTFHYNPEWDFLSISSEWPAQDILINFLYRLKTIHDPRHLGLLNFVIDSNGLLANGLYEVKPSDLDVKARSAFVETLGQLREVWFASTSLVGRQITGMLSGLMTSETIYNRSFPIWTNVPTFERASRDVRPISLDLERTTGLGDMKDLVQLWLAMQRMWCASKPSTDYGLLLCFGPTGDNISDRKSAETWLQKQEDQWNGRGHEADFLRGKQVKWPIGAEAEAYKNEDLSKAVRPAFGFWLFPIEALNAINAGGDFSDMKDHWPELALSPLH